MMNRRYSTPPTWRDALEDIRAARGEIKKMSSYSDTPRFLHQTAAEELDFLIKRYRPGIAAGALGEFEQAIRKHQEATKAVAIAKAKEIVRWDSGSLLRHQDLFRERIATALNGEDPTQDLVDLYQEALDSNDLAIQRAAAEVFKGAPNLLSASAPREVMVMANTIGHQAGRDLGRLRHTEELAAAQAELETASWELIKHKQQLAELSEVVDGEQVPSPFGNVSSLGRASMRVQVRDGQVNVLAADDPEITGIVWLPPKGEEPAG